MSEDKDILQKKQMWNTYLTIGTLLILISLAPLLLMMALKALEFLSFRVFDSFYINNWIDDTFLTYPYTSVSIDGTVHKYLKPFYMGRYLLSFWLWAIIFFVVGCYKIYGGKK